MSLEEDSDSLIWAPFFGYVLLIMLMLNALMWLLARLILNPAGGRKESAAEKSDQDVALMSLLSPVSPALPQNSFLDESTQLFSHTGKPFHPSGAENLSSSLLAFALLASEAYSEPHLNQEGQKTIFSGSYIFCLQATISSGRYHLWKAVSPSKVAFHVLAVRGTHILHDVGADLQLLSSVVLGNDKFEALVQEAFEEIKKDLLPHVSGQLLITGHSLGASIAEALCIMIRTTLNNTLPAMAVSYDTPGLPEVFLKSRGVSSSLPYIVTVNSSINIVNTLHRPLAETFFTVDGGERIQLEKIVPKLVLLSFFASRPLFAVVKVALSLSVASHPMERIIACLKRGEAVRANPNAWPTFSNRALAIVAGWVPNSLKTQTVKAVAKIQPSTLDKKQLEEYKIEEQRIVQERLDREKQQQEAAAKAKETVDKQARLDFEREQRKRAHEQLLNVCEELPSTRAGFALDKLYCIESQEKWNWFPKLLRPNDIVVPLFGHTGAGKSTTLNSMLKLRDKQKAIPVTSGINSSMWPILALIKQPDRAKSNQDFSVFIVDMPGVGAKSVATNDIQDNPFVHEDYSQLFQSLKGYIGMALYVAKDALDTRKVELVQGLKKSGLDVCVAFNQAVDDGDEDGALANLKTHFDASKIFHYCAKKDGQYIDQNKAKAPTVEDLKLRIFDYLAHNCGSVISTQQAHLKERREQREKLEEFLDGQCKEAFVAHAFELSKAQTSGNERLGAKAGIYAGAAGGASWLGALSFTGAASVLEIGIAGIAPFLAVAASPVVLVAGVGAIGVGLISHVRANMKDGEAKKALTTAYDQGLAPHCLDLRVGRIVDVQIASFVSYRLHIELGNQNRVWITSDIKEYFEEGELRNRDVVVVCNVLVDSSDTPVASPSSSSSSSSFQQIDKDSLKSTMALLLATQVDTQNKKAQVRLVEPARSAQPGDDITVLDCDGQPVPSVPFNHPIPTVVIARLLAHASIKGKFLSWENEPFRCNPSTSSKQASPTSLLRKDSSSYCFSTFSHASVTIDILSVEEEAFPS